MTRALSRTFTNVLGGYGTLMARALQGLNPSLKGRARGVAFAIGIALSITSADRLWALDQPYNDLRAIADYQLTDKQYKCHNEIVFRESSNRVMAVNGSHYGFYQMRTTATKTNDAYKQFYVYWYYVASRYGLDPSNGEIPNYCNALKHLKSKGWQ